MDRRSLRTSSASLASLATLAIATLVGCSDEGPPCDHRICDVQDPSCAEFVAAVVACQRDEVAVIPNVRFSTAAEIIAEQEPPTQAELDEERDYWAGEALVGLMPPNYDPADAAADSISGVLAQYCLQSKEIVIISDTDIDDETAYFVLVHEMLHAQQDEEYDLLALFEQYATTFPRSLGLRAAIEGEASFYTTLAQLEVASIPPSAIDWNQYFRDWQDDRLMRARDSEVPSLDVRGLFPYAFGSEQVFRAWSEGGLDEVRKYVQQPPDSVRQIMAGYLARPPQVFNLDSELAPHAVPILPGHTYLGGGGQDAWLLNTMLQRTAGSTSLWSPAVDAVTADHLSVWRNDQTGNRVAVWRLQGEATRIHNMLTDADSRWVEAPEDATTHHIRAVDGDWVLVATETVEAPAVADQITGWQSQAEAFETAELTRDSSPRGLILQHAH